jgi:hypothetical protein
MVKKLTILLLLFGGQAYAEVMYLPRVLWQDAISDTYNYVDYSTTNYRVEYSTPIIVPYIDMLEMTAPATPPTNNLRLYTEAIQGFSFFKYLDDTGMKRQLIRDSMILVKNVRGTTIAASRIVYATGSADGVPTVDTAKADVMATMPAIGVTIESIADGAFGRVMQVGLLENINTSAYSEGDILYVSDSTAGIPTTIAPITPSLTQEIGTVLVVSASTGAIQIIARALTGDEYGTAQNTFYVGDNTAGNKSVIFNGVTNSTVTWNGTTLDLGSNVTITAGALADGVINEPDLNCSNSPTDNYLLSYNQAGTNFTWVVASGGGGGASTLQTSVDGVEITSPTVTLNMVGVFEGYANGSIADIRLSTGAVTNGTVTTVPNSDQVFDFCETTQGYYNSGDAIVAASLDGSVGQTLPISETVAITGGLTVSTDTVITGDMQSATANIAGAITNVEGALTDQSVTTSDIKDATILVGDMAANSIDSDQYVDGSIDAIHLAADIVDETKIEDHGIDSEHYNDASIDPEHLAATANEYTTTISSPAWHDTEKGGALIVGYHTYAITLSTLIIVNINGGTYSVLPKIIPKTAPDGGGLDVWSSSITIRSNEFIGGTFSDATIPANNGVRLNLDTETGNVDELQCIIGYTADP